MAAGMGPAAMEAKAPGRTCPMSQPGDTYPRLREAFLQQTAEAGRALTQAAAALTEQGQLPPDPIAAAFPALTEALAAWRA